MVSTPIKSGGYDLTSICCTMLLAAVIGCHAATSSANVHVNVNINKTTQAPAFTLKDQHRTAHHYQFPRPKISVLIFADYAGSAQLEDWIRPLYGRYRDSIAIDGVAELSSVPRLIRGMVRSAFRDRLPRPVMLDWSGTVSTDYRYQKGEANLFVIDPNGRILLKITGASSDAKQQRVQDVIDRQLNLNRP